MIIWKFMETNDIEFTWEPVCDWHAELVYQIGVITFGWIGWQEQLMRRRCLQYINDLINLEPYNSIGE